MKYKKINKTTGIHSCQSMDIHLSSLGFNKESMKYLLNPIQQHDLNLLHHLKESIEFLKEAINKKERICIVGDYDADGVCSTSILYLTLNYCKANIDYVIPHRIKNGYGLSKEVVDRVINETRASIILTCDNGIMAHEAIDYAKSRGLSVIVTDHHTPSDELPNANFIIHPALGNYPFASISGAQVAYKVAMGILEECSPLKKKVRKTISAKKEEQDLKDYLFQLATITIVSDVMPIASPSEEEAKVNENRQWLIDGISMMRQMPNWHIKMMIEMLNLNQGTFDEQSIGFYIAPCLNAPGRLDDASYAVEYLISQDKKEAKMDLSFLIHLNNERKEVKSEIMNKIEVDEEDIVNIITKEDIHEGILGIIAGGLTNDTGKASIVMTNTVIDGKKAWKGSARGTGEVSLFDVLKEINDTSECIYQFGGHKDAAGLTILDKKLDVFKEEFRNKMEEKLYNSTFEKEYIEVSNRKERLALALAIRDLKPFGQGLPLPQIEMMYNVAEINLYYKSKHAKITQYEVEEKKGKKTFPKLELWLFGGLEKMKPLCTSGHFTKSDNIKRLEERGISKTEAIETRMETYKRKKGETVKIKYLLEANYYDFGGLGPQYSIINIDWDL